MQEFSARQLHAYLQQQEPLLLDVREPWEFGICRIDGSLLLPMGRLPARLEQLDKQREMVVICHHGIRSRQVCYFLRSQGFDKLVNPATGVDGWAKDVDQSMPVYGVLRRRPLFLHHLLHQDIKTGHGATILLDHLASCLARRGAHTRIAQPVIQHPRQGCRVLHPLGRTAFQQQATDQHEIESMGAEGGRHSLRRGLEHIVTAMPAQAATDKGHISRTQHGGQLPHGIAQVDLGLARRLAA